MRPLLETPTRTPALAVELLKHRDIKHPDIRSQAVEIQRSCDILRLLMDILLQLEWWFCPYQQLVPGWHAGASLPNCFRVKLPDFKEI